MRASLLEKKLGESAASKLRSVLRPGRSARLRRGRLAWAWSTAPKASWAQLGAAAGPWVRRCRKARQRAATEAVEGGGRGPPVGGGVRRGPRAGRAGALLGAIKASQQVRARRHRKAPSAGRGGASVRAIEGGGRWPGGDGFCRRLFDHIKPCLGSDLEG
jgi:hypothetical protein